MPIYEYICPKCQNKFELMRSISQSQENADCPKCQMASKRTVSKFVSRAQNDFGFPDSMPATSGSSCASCNSGNCSSCGK